jgi:hypothetical protein
MIFSRPLWPKIALSIALIFATAPGVSSEPPSLPPDTIELEKYVVSERPQGVIPFCFEAVGTSDGAMIVPPVIASSRPGEAPLNNHVASTSNTASSRAFSRQSIRAILRAKGSDVFETGSSFATDGDCPPQLSLEGGGQVVAIGGRDINRFTLFTLRDLWFSGEVGDEVKLVILTGGKAPVFREISVRRISAKKWKNIWVAHSRAVQPRTSGD